VVVKLAPVPTKARPPRYRLSDDEILDAACAVFATQGFDRAKMDTIAATAATTKPTLYARFGPKEALFAAAVRREHELLTERLFTAYDSGKDEPFRRRLHRWNAAGFDFVRERPNGFRLSYEAERYPAAAEIVQRAIDERIDRIARLVVEISGRPEGAGPRLVAAMIVGAHKWCAREAVRNPETSIDAAAALCESFLYGALRNLDADLMEALG
jgi:AcrR family transcriptional regulator